MSDDLVQQLRELASRTHDINDHTVLHLSADEIERLRSALAECCAPFDTGPTTVLESAALVQAEFQRRIDIAANAISYYCAQCPTRGTCIDLGRCVARPTKETER